jgi:hypothetical protein
VSLAQFGDRNRVLGPPSSGPRHGGGERRRPWRRGGLRTGAGLRTGTGRGSGGHRRARRSSRHPRAVTAPVLLWKIDPEYTGEARRSKIPGGSVCGSGGARVGRPHQRAAGLGAGLGRARGGSPAALEVPAGPPRWPARGDGARVEVTFRLL